MAYSTVWHVDVVCGNVQADFGTIVSKVATDPAVQAAAVHVMEAANTEVAALHALSASDSSSSVGIKSLGAYAFFLSKQPFKFEQLPGTLDSEFQHNRPLRFRVGVMSCF